MVTTTIEKLTKYAVRENKCKARYCAAQKDFAAKRDLRGVMTAPEDDNARADSRLAANIWIYG